MKIEVVRLRKHFVNAKAVDDISFTFNSGEIIGFVGPNGAGKTTTMRMMATLDEPTDGDVFFDDVSVVESPERVRELMGYVPESLPGHREMTVHEYLDFFARAYGVRGEQRRKIVEEIEEFTNLLGIRDKFLNDLSKGMGQRVCLARALVHDPQVLIMDEPASGLDPRARVELRELLKVLATQGKAILISSHILTELAEICTGTVIIERGKLLKAGSLQEITKEECSH
ncbi:MAG TPA: ABC transporter ATP-binding protein, partial [Candidatus Ozemobacteraceae bacterium]|nr:ABC transporter ATP-binding protein [Candidatus Ozemobacteraceae bacterium]